jgi:hypothetical protein
MPAHKWKIFTNENQTRFVAAYKDGSVVYDGGSEVEALREILRMVSSLKVEPVVRQWAEQPVGTLRGANEHRRGVVSRENWWPSLYEDNK